MQSRIVRARTLHKDVCLFARIVHMIYRRKVYSSLQVAVSHWVCPCITKTRRIDIRVDIDYTVQVILILIGTQVYIIAEALFAACIHTCGGYPSQIVYIICIGILGKIILIEVIATLVEQTQRRLQGEVASLDIRARCSAYLRVGEVRSVNNIVVNVRQSYIVVPVFNIIERIVGDIGIESSHGIMREHSSRCFCTCPSRQIKLRAVVIVAP